jgi:hypothetical protein
VIECQHCGAQASDERTYCPACRRRIKPSRSPAAASAATASVAPQPTPPATPVEIPPPPIPPLSPTRGRDALATAACAALVVTAAVQFWRIFAYLHRASIADAIGRGDVTIAAAQHADDQVRASGGVNLIVLLVTATLFIVWFYRMVTDLERKHPGVQRYGTGWAIGAWFVPILNLFRPKQMLDDAWKAPATSTATVPAWVHAWWALWLVGNFVSSISGPLTGTSAEAIADHDRIDAAACVLLILAATLAVAVVRGLTQRVRNSPPLLVRQAYPTAATGSP